MFSHELYLAVCCDWTAGCWTLDLDSHLLIHLSAENLKLYYCFPFQLKVKKIKGKDN